MRFLSSYLLLVAVLCLGSLSVTAQCSFEVYQEKSAAKMPTNHKLLKSYHLDGKGGEKKEVEVKLNLRKNENYFIQLAGADGGAEGIIAAVKNNRGNEVASSYDHTGYREQFNYRCRASGVYTIVFYFKDTQDYCGAATVSVEAK